jgi:lycopene beta-cyclase
MSPPNFDIVLVGGGLQNALIALALSHSKAALSLAMVEQGARLGGNHLWCFHSADLPSSAAGFVEPLVVQRWPGYDVHFQSSTRQLDEPYAATNSERLHEAVTELAERQSNLTLLLGETATRVSPGGVTLASGVELGARLVIDARGPEAFSSHRSCGYQKFVGLELEVRPGDAPARPIVMDARVEQRDGFHFFYVLPLGDRRVLVENTYFSDEPALDVERFRGEIAEYARELRLPFTSIVREERGVLPLPTRRIPRLPQESGVIRAGYQGGWFHPTTGYSFPVAVRLAAELGRCRLEEMPSRVESLARERERQQRYCTFLNRLLFEAFAPEQRANVFERFYRLPAATVRRFYAMNLSATDRARILCGRPPRGFRAWPLFAAHAAKLPEPPSVGDNA